MKKFLLSFTVLFVLASVLFAAAPTDKSVDANVFSLPSWFETLTPTKVTLTGSGDTTTLAYRWAPKYQGSDIILVRSKIRGSKEDSVGAIVFVDCLNSSYALLYTVAVDTIIDSLGEAIRLPIGSVCQGSYYNIRLVSGVPSTANRTHRTGADSVATYNYIYYPQSVIRQSTNK